MQTDRCEHFFKIEYRKKAANILKNHGIDNLVVIGGDGLFTGAKLLSEETGIKVVGIPGTIDILNPGKLIS